MKILIVVSLCLTYLIYGSIAAISDVKSQDGGGCAALRKANPFTIGQISLDMYCDEKVVCAFEFTNKGPKDIYILKRNTPLEGLISQFITVYSQAGRPLEYQGPHLFRLPPSEEEFVLLKAGKSISANVDITRAFSFDSDGLYTIEYSKPVQYVTRLMLPYKLRNAIVRQSGSIYLEDTHFLPKPQIMEEKQNLQKETITTQSGCTLTFTATSTQTQRDGIQAAHDYVCSYIGNVKDGIANNDLYKTWFGSYTSSRVATVNSVFQKVNDGIKTKTVTYVMSGGSHCTSRTFAYTWKGTSTVYNCPLLYDYGIPCINFLQEAGNPNAYSQEGVVMHELAHSFGYTDDHSYGIDNDKALACDKPDVAIDNADNYAYYYCKASHSHRG